MFPQDFIGVNAINVFIRMFIMFIRVLSRVTGYDNDENKTIF